MRKIQASDRAPNRKGRTFALARLLHVALAALFLPALAACSAPKAAQDANGQTVTLTYASLYPPQHPFSRADRKWIELIERVSNGRIAIRPFWSGALITSEQNMLEARHGVADIVMITPMYARDAHLQRVQASFYPRMPHVTDQPQMYRCLAARFPVLNSELGALHILAVQGGNYPGLLTRNRPVLKLADLKGLRLRTQRDMAGIVRSYGGDPVDMPMSEVYSSMARGVIDGVLTPPDAMASMHLAEVGRYFTALNVPRGAYPARAMASARWNALPQDVRAMLDRTGPEWDRLIATEVENAQARGFSEAKTNHVTMHALPDSDDTALQAAYAKHSVELARELSRDGIDAEPIVMGSWEIADRARKSGKVECAPAPPAG